MSASAAVQWLIVGAIVAVSAFYALGIFAPRVRVRALYALGGWLAQERRPRWMRFAGRRLMPASQAASGCGSGCSSCNGCGSASDKPQVQPLLFTRDVKTPGAAQQRDRDALR
jgi:hypothetical protein